MLVGVADDITQLVYDHNSIAARNLSQVHMKRMSKEEVTEIVCTRIKRLRMTISEDAVWRIAYFSSGPAVLCTLTREICRPFCRGEK